MYGHMQRHKHAIFSNAASGMHTALTELLIHVHKRLTSTEDKCLQSVDGAPAYLDLDPMVLLKPHTLATTTCEFAVSLTIISV